jgi:hypothetical protein
MMSQGFTGHGPMFPDLRDLNQDAIKVPMGMLLIVIEKVMREDDKEPWFLILTPMGTGYVRRWRIKEVP